MTDQDWLAARFEDHRTHLRAVAYRMLGSTAEAEDAVQEAWLRASRARREEPLEPDAHVPDPVVTREDDPEQAALLGDAVGLALLVVLETLTPPERVAFVLHDMFALPFEEIAPMLERSPAAVRQLASRGRRRARAAVRPEGAPGAQREVVDAFFAAARGGDFDGLVAVLDPDVVLRSDGGASRPGLTTSVRGAAAVAGRALTFANPAARLHPVLVNGGPGVVVTVRDRPFSLLAFTIAGGRIAEIDAIAEPERVARVAGPALPA